MIHQWEWNVYSLPSTSQGMCKVIRAARSAGVSPAPHGCADGLLQARRLRYKVLPLSRDIAHTLIYQLRESGTGSHAPPRRIDSWLTSPGSVMSIASWMPIAGGRRPQMASTKSTTSK